MTVDPLCTMNLFPCCLLQSCIRTDHVARAHLGLPGSHSPQQQHFLGETNSIVLILLIVRNVLVCDKKEVFSHGFLIRVMQLALKFGWTLVEQLPCPPSNGEHHENEVEVNVKTPTVTDVTNDLPTGCLPGVSQEMWQVCCIQYDVSRELLFICALLFLCVIIQLGKTFNCSYPAFPLYVKPILYCIFERDARLKQLLFHLIYVCITFGYLLCCVFKEIQ